MTQAFFVCVMLSATALAAEPAGSQQFKDAVGELIKAINANNQAAIQAMFNPAMQNLLPPTKSGQFFGGLLAAKGKLGSTTVEEINGPTAAVRVKAARGDCRQQQFQSRAARHQCGYRSATSGTFSGAAKPRPSTPTRPCLISVARRT